jgi:hypothetical protein
MQDYKVSAEHGPTGADILMGFYRAKTPENAQKRFEKEHSQYSLSNIQVSVCKRGPEFERQMVTQTLQTHLISQIDGSLNDVIATLTQLRDEYAKPGRHLYLELEEGGYYYGDYEYASLDLKCRELEDWADYNLRVARIEQMLREDAAKKKKREQAAQAKADKKRAVTEAQERATYEKLKKKFEGA